MNRFEIIAERIGVLGKTMSDYETMYELKRSVEQLELSLRGAMFDNPEEVQFIKMQITDALFYLLVYGSKRDHCGACMCSDLEAKVKHITERADPGMSMTVMQPTVVNQNNVPKDADLLTGLPEELKEKMKNRIPDLRHPLKEMIVEDSEKISERGPELKRYQIECDIFAMSGTGSQLGLPDPDKERFVSVFTLPVTQNTDIQDNPFYTQLCMDLQKASGFPWYAEKKAGFIALKTQNRCNLVSLITVCTLKGEGVTRV